MPHQPMRRRDRRHPLPQRRQLDTIDPLAPGVEGHVAWLDVTFGQLLEIEILGNQSPQGFAVAGMGRVQICGQEPAHGRTQCQIRGPRIVEAGSGLQEGHGQRDARQRGHCEVYVQAPPVVASGGRVSAGSSR